jgi:hypothetical protein
MTQLIVHFSVRPSKENSFRDKLGKLELGQATKIDYGSVSDPFITSVFSGNLDLNQLLRQVAEFEKNGLVDYSRTICLVDSQVYGPSRKLEEDTAKACISEKIFEDGNAIFDQFRKYLSTDRAADLSSFLNALSILIPEMESTHTVRDLQPFVLMLQRTFDNPEKWDLFEDHENFDAELNNLRSILWRAYRNRIDALSTQADPSYAGGDESGCAKTLQSYTLFCYLAGYLLGIDSKFSVCVVRGSEGTVVCEEFFEYLYKLKQERSEDWTVEKEIEERRMRDRLLSIGISGPTLFQPEVAFAHCVHEIAEYGGWRRKQDLSPLMVDINKWQIEEVTHWLAIRAEANDNAGQSLNEKQKKESIYAFIERAISPNTLAVPPYRFSETFESELEDMVAWSIDKAVSNEWSDVDSEVSRTHVPPKIIIASFARNYIDRGADDYKELMIALAAARYYADESTADFAMCCLIRCLVETDKFSAIIDYVFSSIVDSVVAASPLPKTPLLARNHLLSILNRWFLMRKIFFPMDTPFTASRFDLLVDQLNADWSGKRFLELLDDVGDFKTLLKEHYKQEPEVRYLCGLASVLAKHQSELERSIKSWKDNTEFANYSSVALLLKDILEEASALHAEGCRETSRWAAVDQKRVRVIMEAAMASGNL